MRCNQYLSPPCSQGWLSARSLCQMSLPPEFLPGKVIFLARIG
jgi:hypothetical protein